MPVPAQHGHGLKLVVDAMVVPNCVDTHPSGLRSLLGSWTPANQVRGDLGLPSVSLACPAKVEKEEGHLGDKVGSQSPPAHTRGGAGLARREQSGSSEGRCRRYRPTSPRRRRAATPSITLGSATVRPVPRAPFVRRSRRLKISARPDPEPRLTKPYAPTSTPSRAAPTFQMTRYYRYGELDSCEGRWDAIWACMDSRKRSGQGLSSKAPVIADAKEERAKPYWNLMDPKVRLSTDP